MKKKKFVVFVLFFCLMAFIDLIKVEAKPEYSEIMGIYTISAPVKAPKKVYVEQDVIKYLEDSGIDVRTEVIEESFWFFKKKTYNYFYIANKYVEEIVYTRQISNDVDSMIFMVKELEQRVIEVNGGKLDKNIVLAYIRSINKEYVGNYIYSYSVVCGDAHADKIKEINKRETDKIGLKLFEYFAQFISFTGEKGYELNGYNNELHGEVRDEFKNSNNVPKRLTDPNNKNKGIDLIHMFASIDGIYKDTERGAVRALMPGRNKIERDIVSWSGDLQQAVSKIYKAIHHPADGKSQLTYSAFDEESNQKMNLIFKNEYDCSEDDILADIDAMNIVKMYLDNDKMSLSDSLNAYYWFVSNNKTFRYQTFIKTVIIDEEKKENVDNKTSLERFEIEVCSQFDVKKTGSNYIEYDYYGDSNEWRFKFMLDENGKLIDSRIRIFVVKSFIEYIEANMWD